MTPFRNGVINWLLIGLAALVVIAILLSAAWQ
jgi:hypothetical protein